MLILIPIGWLLAVGVGLTLDPSLIGWSLLYSLPSLPLVVIAWGHSLNTIEAVTPAQYRRFMQSTKFSEMPSEMVYAIVCDGIRVCSILIAAACPLGVLWQLGGAS